MSIRRQVIALNAVLIVGAVAFTTPAPQSASRAAIPDRLADSTFWRLVSTFSEPSGTFASENFVSNETEWQYVIPPSLGRVKQGSAYLGVGPEQNFTYMTAFRPRIAFICDIRRQNLVQHLMYKALIEMSSDRADFLSRLWSRARPDGLDSASTAAELVGAYRNAKPDSLLLEINRNAIFARLVRQHKFALTSDDSTTLRAVYQVFFNDGPNVSYSSSSRRGTQFPPGILGNTAPGWIFNPVVPSRGTSGTVIVSMNGVTNRYVMTTDSLGRPVTFRDSSGTLVKDTTLTMPALRTPFASSNPMNAWSMPFATFGSLMLEDDGAGVNRGWLGSEAAFQWLKDFQLRNLVVPVVGNFAGPKALRAIGTYLKEHDSRVGTFYTSNVEQYLFQSGIDGDFYENVATLPMDSSSMFIRSFPSNIRGAVMPRNSTSRLAQTTSSIELLIRAYRNGLVATYQDLAQLQDR